MGIWNHIGRAATVAFLLLAGASYLHAQIADSTMVRKQGEPLFVTGKGIMLSGAITAAAGGSMMLLVLAYDHFNPVPVDQLNENWVPAVLYGIGLYTVMAGAAVTLAGIPVTVAGHSLMQCDVPWRDARYDSAGPGVIIEGAYYLPDIIEARGALGYHFNPHLFFGAGVAPGIWLDQSSRDQSISRLSLPVYADFRWSMCNRFVSPYLGLSAGLELADDPFSPYLGADFGARIRMDRTSTNSFWSGISGEVAGGYYRVGIKMGYSF